MSVTDPRRHPSQPRSATRSAPTRPHLSSSTPPCATASSRPAAPCTAPKSCAWPTRSPRSASTSSRPASPSPPRATPNPSAPSPAKSSRPHHRLARPLQARGHRGRRPLHRARRPRPHPHLPLHLRPAPRRQAQDHPRRRRSTRSPRWSPSPRTYCDDVEFSPEDATRTDPDFLVKVCEVAIQAGATTLNLPDTVGYCIPQDYADMFRDVRARVPGIENIVLSAHCHDDLGLAVANTIASIEAGVRQVECAINGIGERAGNASLEELAAIFITRRDKLPYRHNIVMNQLYPTSQMLADVHHLRRRAQQGHRRRQRLRPRRRHPPARRHGQPAHLRDHDARNPSASPHNSLVLGKHSGRRALEQRLVELGHTLTRERTRRRLHPLHRTRRPQKNHLRPGPPQPAQTRTQSHRMPVASIAIRRHAPDLYDRHSEAKLRTNPPYFARCLFLISLGIARLRIGLLAVFDLSSIAHRFYDIGSSRLSTQRVKPLPLQLTLGVR